MAARVLVTDGEQRSALAACRGLAAAGYRVSALAPARSAGALWSVACSERLVGPDPKREPEAFVERVAGLVRTGRYDCLLPGSDASLLALSDGREQLGEHVLHGIPPREAVNRSLDKDALHAAAAGGDLAAPASIACERPDQVDPAATAIGFPLVVKPPRTLREAEAGRRQQPVTVVHDARQLRAEIDHMGLPVILQELLDDARRFSFGGVLTGEGLTGYALARFHRTWPPPAGAVSFGQTVAPPPGIASTVAALVERIGWRGIFELEYLETADGQRHAIDLNPRVFGWLSLANAAGANLAALWCGSLLGRTTSPAVGRAGVRYRWEEADVAHLAWQLRRGHLRAAAAVARPHRSVVHAQFRLRDPGPLVARAVGLAAARTL